MEKILAAMSGGVDSSVAALLLAQGGDCEVHGAYMKNWINEDNIAGDCPWMRDIEDARMVADQIGIPFRVVNLMREYRGRVVDYLLQGYQSGVTPNPDVMCNREIKFGAFLQYAIDNGFDGVATGHYVRRLQAPDQQWDLIEGLDKNKDQSYFLALLNQQQVARARFPIGHLPKPEVRRLAAEAHLQTSGKKDSQGICFIGQIRMSDFLRTYIPDSPGEVVTPSGKSVGRHRGLHLYTLGQRRGLGIPSNTPHQAYVVVAKQPDTNTLVVDFETPDTPGLFTQAWLLESLSFIREVLNGPREVLARPRYRAPATSAFFRPNPHGTATLIFDQPQRAVTPGQICALYDGERLLGGGVFSRPLDDSP